jgi:hypothetical protein
MNWDDEELDTQIFDKEPPEPTRTLEADDLFFEDDDRTVANEPPPDILEQARPPEALITPRPRTQEISPAARRTPVAPLPVPQKTLFGMPAPSVPQPARNTGVHAVGAGPPPGLAGVRRSGLNLPPPNLGPAPSGPHPSQPVFSFDQPQSPFTSGTFPTERAGKPQRSGLYAVLAVLALVVIGGTYYYYWTVSRPGKIQLVTVPSDAVVLLDNGKVGDHSPLSIEKAPGPYTLSVTRDGYVRNDQNIEVRAGQPLVLNVTLEPSPDTGFELTSDPPGGLVWLDGAPISGPNGQARTDFRAYRIPPGHHVLEIKGESRFKPWRQDIEVEPGAIRKIHATLIPVGEGEKVEKVAARAREPRPEPPPPPLAPPKMPAAPLPPGPTATPPGGLAANLNDNAATPPTGRVVRRRKPRGEAAAPAEPADPADDVKETPKERPAAAEGGGDCLITIGSRPWSEVWIDGKNTGKHTPFADYKIACGKHKVVFKRPDLNIDHSESITVRAGEKFKQSYTLANDSE